MTGDQPASFGGSGESPAISASIERCPTESRSDRLRHGDRRLARPAVRGRVARSRDRRRDLLRRQRRGAPGRGNTLAVLELAGRIDIEVALGRTVPLVRPLEIDARDHGPQGLGHAELPPPTRPLSERHAADVMIGAARERPGEITLVTLGPMTNLAVALDREPDLPRLLRRLVLMGGAYPRPGQYDPDDRVEHPLRPGGGEDRVFAGRSAPPATPRRSRLGLDVTEKARVLPEHVVELARRAGSTPDDSIALAQGEDPLVATRSVAANPIVRYVADALRFYMEFHAHYDGFYGAFIHDPLALAAALDPSLVTTQAVHVDVDTAGGPGDGQTVADWRRR